MAVQLVHAVFRMLLPIGIRSLLEHLCFPRYLDLDWERFVDFIFSCRITRRLSQVYKHPTDLCLLICLFNKYSLRLSFVTGTYLGIRNTVINQMDKALFS